jgi:transposase-like protein
MRASGRRFAQRNGPWPAWRCQACDRYYTLLSGTVFEKTRRFHCENLAWTANLLKDALHYAATPNNLLMNRT